MSSDEELAQAIADVGLYEFRRQLQYKGVWYGCEVVLADRLFPSIKLCSQCGSGRQIRLADRVYRCEAWGLVLDRDLNAAINLEQWLYL